MADIKRKVPNLRFKGFTDDWEQRKLGDEYKHIGNAFVGTASPYYTQNGYFYLESNNINNGQINHDHEVFINESFYHKQLNKLLHTGDLVMVQSGHVGDTAVITEKYNGTAAHALIMFRKPQNNMLSFFLNSFFQSSNAKNRIDVLAIGNTIRHILASDMKKFVVYLPDNKEKVEVVELFLELQKLISLQQRKLDLLKQLKKGLLQKMFAAEKNSKQPALRFKEFHDDWEQRKLASLFTKFTDGDWIESKDQASSGIRLVQTGNIGITEFINKFGNEKWISEETFKKLNCEEIFPGDIIISRLPDPAGRACILPKLKTRMITAVDCTIARTSRETSAEFIVQYLSTQTYFKYVQSCLAGGTRQRISRKNLADFNVSIPTDIKEQKQIGDFFKQLDSLIALHQRKQNHLKLLKKSLLQQMFM